MLSNSMSLLFYSPVCVLEGKRPDQEDETYSCDGRAERLSERLAAQ